MKTYEIHLDDSLAEKFEIALQLTGETADEAIAKLARTYLADTFSAAANSMRGENGRSASQEQPQPERRTARRAANQPNAPHSNVRVEEESQENFFSKAINRIPRGANKPNQHTHKILRAFWELQDEIGKVTPEALRSRCSDPTSHPDTFVPHFDNDYAQMKFDNGNSHGKVFEEKDGEISIWDRISDTLAHYRDYFM